MKGKRSLTRILACSLSFLMFLTAPADAVFAQSLTQETEEIEADAIETEIEESATEAVPATEMPETEEAEEAMAEQVPKRLT